jgi:RimJ/RimL family protein N-acetyltransferase
MLELEQFEVKLRRISMDDIELVRNWRNSEFVRSKMFLKDPISREQQLAWFQSIDNARNYYFIIEFDQKDVGVINAKDFSMDNGFGEGGIFIGEPDYESSFAAVYASLCLLNFVYYGLGNINKSRIRILKSNERAIQYNKLLGYNVLESQDNENSLLMELTKENFFTKGIKLNKAAAIFCEDKLELKWKGEPSEKNIPEINHFLTTKNSPWVIPDFQKL